MTVEEIIKDMLSNVPEEYDNSVGSFFYDLLYPVAERIYILQNKISELRENAFALTATGQYLDRKVAEKNIERKIATFSKGIVRISGDVGATVQQGAKVAANDILFAVDEETIISDSGCVDVSATCIIAGAKGNVGIGEINRFPVTLPKLAEVTNITAFTGGYDEENDSELLERYIEKVSRPTASGNTNHYIEWAKEVNGVGDAQVIPCWNGAGTVKVIIVDSLNHPANEELLSEVVTNIEKNRPVGADVTVVSAEPLEINISVTIITEDQTKALEDIKKSIARYLSDAALKKKYISYAKIGSYILSVDIVEDYSNLSVNGGSDNINITDGAVPVLGSVVFV